MNDDIFRPWKIDDQADDHNGGYIAIRGANDESICQIFPLAGRGGVGVEAARRLAWWIVNHAGTLP